MIKVLNFTTVAWTCKLCLPEHWLPWDTLTDHQFARSKTLVFSILLENYIKLNVSFSGKRQSPLCELKTWATSRPFHPPLSQNKSFWFITWSVFCWPSVVLFTLFQILPPLQKSLSDGASTCQSLQSDTLMWNKITDFEFMHCLQTAAHGHIYFCLALIRTSLKKLAAWIKGSNCSSPLHEFNSPWIQPSSQPIASPVATLCSSMIIFILHHAVCVTQHQISVENCGHKILSLSHEWERSLARPSETGSTARGRAVSCWGWWLSDT